MKHWLLSLALLAGRPAAAQPTAPRSPLPAVVLPPLPEASLQTAVSTTTPSNPPGIRYQYQLVHLDDRNIWLAPAWEGKTKLEPPRNSWDSNPTGELDTLLMQALNELAADGWELLEIRTVAQPTEAVQRVERDLVLNDPERPRYTGTTTIQTSLQTRYLFRRPLSR